MKSETFKVKSDIRPEIKAKKARSALGRALQCILFVFLLASHFSLPTPLFAAKIHPRAGTTAAAFLKLDPSPRSVAMAGAHTAVADDAYAGHWNPAGLTQLKGPEGALMYNRYFQDLDQEFVSLALPLPSGSALGLAWNGLRVPKDLERRSGAGEDIPTAALTASEGTFGASDMAGALSLAHRWGKSFSAGASLKLIQQKIDTLKESAYALDAGILWRPGRGSWSFGAGMQNLGPSVRFLRKAYDLPLTYNAGAAWRGFGERLLLAVDARQPIDNYLSSGAGAEYWLLKFCALRAGYRYRINENELGALSGLGAGMGLRFKFLQVDYAFAPFGDLGNTHRIGLLVRLPGPAVPHQEAVAPPAAAPLPPPAPTPAEPEPSRTWPLSSAVKQVRISPQGAVHEVLAAAPADCAIQRLFFRTRGLSSGAVPDMVLLEDIEPPKTADVPVYASFRLGGNAPPASGRMGVVFRVPKTWLQEKSLTPDRIAFYAKGWEGWIKQPTRRVSEGETFYEFKADVDLFEHWIIGAQ